uniref:Uncharacterized protein n=1 Tax=Gopherus agassizii TaxID=38772 RepID=A0A452GVM1_9SAUR
PTPRCDGSVYATQNGIAMAAEQEQQQQQQFYLLLGNLLSPDNTVRKQAEPKYDTCS